MSAGTSDRILAIKLADIGDVLLITPALRAIRQTFPAATLDVLVTPNGAAALGHSMLVDNLLVFDQHAFAGPRRALGIGQWWALAGLVRRLRAGHYDTVFLFHHLTLRSGALKHAALIMATGAQRRVGLDNGRGWFLNHRVPDLGFGVRHELDYWLELPGLLVNQDNPATAAEWPRQVEMVITSADRDKAAQWLPDMGDRRNQGDAPTVALHPGSGGYSLARRWDLERFAELGAQLACRARVVIVGTLSDGTEAIGARLGNAAVDLGGKTSLTELAAVLERCSLVVGADSGVLHVAAAVGTPVVALFGPTNHDAWVPALPPEKRTLVRSGSACSPCAYVGHDLGTPEGCPERTCLAMIDVGRVMEAVNRALHGSLAENLPVDPPRASQTARAVDILGIPVHAVTYDGLLDHIGEFIASGRPHQVATVNPEFVMAARRDPIFRVILRRSSLCLPDGIGLIWASRWLQRSGKGGHPLRQRVTGSDGVPRIACRAAKEGWRVFLLGAAPGVAERTAAILTSRFPGLQIAGIHSGSAAAAEEEEIVQRVNHEHTDILLVAYGAPRQDKWIARNLPRLQVGVAMGVGGTFDYISGETPRAPAWLCRFGLEWMYRLVHQPWRWRRMLALPRFACAVAWAGLRPHREGKPRS